MTVTFFFKLYLIVVRTLNIGSTLLTNFKYAIKFVDYRYIVIQQVFKSYSPYLIETWSVML